MRFYVEAWSQSGQILGNLDGQRVWDGVGYARARWYRELKAGRTWASQRVTHWKIVDASGLVLEIIHRPAEQLSPGLFTGHSCWRCKDGKQHCAQGHPNSCEFPHARND